MKIEIKKALLEVTSDELNNAFSKQFKNSFGNKFNKGIDQISPTTSVGQQITNLKSAQNSKNNGPITISEGFKSDSKRIENKLNNFAIGYRDIPTQDKNDYKKAISPMYPKIGGIYNDSPQTVKILPKDRYLSGNDLKGMNAIINNHEQTEYNQFRKSNNPNSMAGQQFGHHSLSKILGRERNNIVTGDDGIKNAGQKLNENVRSPRGEINNFLAFTPKNKDGLSVINSPEEYKDGPRLNRSFLRNMYYKELGLQPKNRFDAITKIKGIVNSQKNNK